MTCQPGQHPRLRKGRLLGCLWVAQLSRTTWIGLLAATWRSHAAADHGAVERAERGEQGSGGVALVVVRHGLAAPGLDRQSGLGAVERLDLALFVEREHHGVGRRIDIEPDDVGRFGGKAGIARALKGPQAMWLYRGRHSRPRRDPLPRPPPW